MSDFIYTFFPIFIVTVVVLGMLWLVYLLKSQNIVQLKNDQKAEVTGHKWDEDLEELNNPLPRWWRWLYILTIIFSVVYLLLYPGLGTFKGLTGWTSQQQYNKEVAAAEAKYAAQYKKYSTMDISTLAKNKEANDMGKRLFLTYCIQCHGSDARGAKGFPNLTDNDWLYGGKAADIYHTIANGRHGQMAPWGAKLGEEKIKDVANYVLKLAKRPYDEERAVRGVAIFSLHCTVCHGTDGRGNQTLGAPNLTDSKWLHGSSEEAIIETITNGRDNQMPAWKDFLGDEKVHLLSAYVYSLSNQ